MTNAFLDKKFVTTAVIIAIIYTCLVILINITVGKEAASIAGVALTALATAIFKQFETLRFKNDINNVTTISYKFSWWQVLLIGFLFGSIADVLSEPIWTLINHFFNIPLYHINDDDEKVLSIQFVAVNKAIDCLGFMIGGAIATKAFKRISYSVIIIAALLGVLVQFYTQYVVPQIIDYDPSSKLLNNIADYKYSFLYIVFAFIGSYFAQFNKSKS